MLFAYLDYAATLKNQLGLVYLAALFLKIIFFVIVFKDVVLGDVLIPRIERLSMLVPLVLFLFVEVFFISKILKRL